MSKVVQLIIKLIVIIGFAGVLLSIFLDWGGRFELVCCTVTAVGRFALFRRKREIDHE